MRPTIKDLMLPSRLSWSLPILSMNELDKFIDGCKVIAAHHGLAWEISTIDDDEFSYFNFDMAGMSFPGFFKGRTLENGEPALNEYDVHLSRKEARAMQELWRLLVDYGAGIEWERLDNTVTV